MVTSSLALVFKMSSLHVLYLLFPKSPSFSDCLIDAVTGSLYIEFSWFLLIIFAVFVPLIVPQIKDLFWSLLSYRCGDMVISSFFYKFALILPMYFSN